MGDLAIPKNGRLIGECIYCGAKKDALGREHAVPYSINGPWTLLQASCSSCANITHRFERDTTKGLLGPVRAVLAMQSRRLEQRPPTLPMIIERHGAQETIAVPLNEYPAYLPLPILPAWRTSSSVWDKDGSMEVRFTRIAGPTLEDFAKKYEGATFTGARLTFSPDDFARTIAKIGYCAAVLALGIEPFKASPIKSYILGDGSSPSLHVGSWFGEPLGLNGLHAMKVHTTGTDVHVVMQLFAQFGAPSYHVYLGEADTEYRANSWPWD